LAMFDATRRFPWYKMKQVLRIEGGGNEKFFGVRGGKSMKQQKALWIAAALIVCGGFSAEAAHKDVKHCADDYRKYCHQWGLETKGLENCMRKHGDRLTNACVAALVKSGEVSQAEVDRRRKQLGR
jgi:hypothetical protein